MSTAFVFPGQGSHRAGALSSWTEHPAARVLDEITAGLGRDVVAISEDEGAGSRTADAQPAIMAASLVAWQALVDAGVQADLVAGHSLGEYTATVAAGAMDVRSCARLVGVRGTAMGEACAANPGTMAAVVKLSPDAVAVLVDGIEGLVIANDNAPGQVVVAGTPEAVDAVRSRARDAGGRALPLDVEGAFHSPAMASAVDAVSAALEAYPLSDPVVPLVSGATAREIERAEPLADALVAGILSPVRWREVQLRLGELGVEDLVEIGPGGVLSGLAKRTLPGVRVHAIATPDDLDGVVAALGSPAGVEH
ncbi:MAG: ACP S-malonyltransferase [Nitriliruptoraceae bacterium]